MKNLYITFKIPYKKIRKLINDYEIKKLNIFIDFLSLAKHNLKRKDNIYYELNEYMENSKPTFKILDEYANFLNRFHYEFENIKIFTVTFFDSGENLQNKMLLSNYKNKNVTYDFVQDSKEFDIYEKLKKASLDLINIKFNKPGYSRVYDLKEYESDLIPYYLISNNKYESLEKTTMNLILSNDKDLLQCCQFNNTIQCTNRYFSSREKNKFAIDLFDDYNAISYFNKTFVSGQLTSKYVPMILSLAGDERDGIKGIKGIGYKKAIKLIIENSIPHQFKSIKNPPDILLNDNNMSILEKNYKLISFDEQIKRIRYILEKEENTCKK